MMHALLLCCLLLLAARPVEGADAATAARRAVAQAEATVQAQPQSAAAQRDLAIALGHLTDHAGNREKMELSRKIHAAARRATELDPRDPLPWEILGRWEYGFATLNPVLRMAARLVYGKLPSTSLAEAARLLERSIALDGQRISPRYHLALVYDAMGRKADAAAQRKALLALPAKDAEDRANQQAARK